MILSTSRGFVVMQPMQIEVNLLVVVVVVVVEPTIPVALVAVGGHL
jgi:hypothetical protein